MGLFYSRFLGHILEDLNVWLKETYGASHGSPSGLFLEEQHVSFMIA